MNTIMIIRSAFFPVISAIFILSAQYASAQKFVTELGVGIGTAFADNRVTAKGEFHFNVLRTYNFGQVGLDFSTGGNLNPYDAGTLSLNGDIQIINASETRFGSVALLYRLPIKKRLFIAPRIGYSSLSTRVNSDEQEKIARANLTAGIGFGGTFNAITISLRYQYLGFTEDFEGTSGSLQLLSRSQPVSVVLLRISYQIGLDTLFKIKKE